MKFLLQPRNTLIIYCFYVFSWCNSWLSLTLYSSKPTLRKLSSEKLFPFNCSYTFAPALKKNQHQIILGKATELFIKYGIKNLTMDDVARELGMSKKTIYAFVANKAELVKLTLMAYIEEERSQVDAIVKISENSIDEMIQMVSYYFTQTRDFNPSALNDLQKYYPETYAIYIEYRLHHMLGLIVKNLESGKKQGVYREDVDADIISKVYISSIDILINQQLFPAEKYAFIDIYKEYINYHLRGIVSDKGLKIFEKHNLFKS